MTQKQPGAPPGTLVHVGDEEVEKEEVTVDVIDYNQDEIVHEEVNDYSNLKPYKDKDSVTWINVNGVHDAEVIRQVGENFELHPLVQEDIMNTGQRAKVEEYENTLYLVLRMFQSKAEKVESEQVSLVVGNNYVVSFQETQGDVFDPIRERLKKDKGRVRKSGPDYLAYALMDAIVDHYFIILEHVGEDIEKLQEGLIDDPTPEKLEAIHELKREVVYLRKAVWPLREVISGLQRGAYDLVTEDTHLYLRDLYDHVIQAIDNIETYRDMISSMLDIYMSSISNRMNEVMKVLTIIATIFIPLTFIAGVYGMNFEYMPELTWQWAYFATLGVMLVVAVVMLTYFKRKSWI